MATYKVVDADQLNADMTSVANIIRTKGGTTGELAWPDGYKTAIAAIQTGGGGIVPTGTKEIAANGIYDVTEYAAVDVAVPTSGGGSEEEWIGDGNTHVWIHLAEGRTSPMLGCCPNGTVTVDWGDGTTPDTLTGTSLTTVKWTPTHHYAAAGDYVITLTVDGTMGFYGSSSSNQYSGILRYSSSGDTRNYGYWNAVQKIEVGSGVTGISSYAFYNCYSLASITIPDSVTSIGSSAFYSCYSLASITIPDSVTSLGGSAFYRLYSLSKIRFESATPPTVAASNSFSNIPTDCIISVPVGSLAAYTSATNYPSSSTYTYIEED